MADNNPATTPGARIREAREAASLSQAQLAELCGWATSSSTGQSRVGNYERDEREPSRTDYIKLAKALGVSPAYLQFGETRPALTSVHGNTEPVGAPRRVPLISWVQAGHRAEAHDPYMVGEGEEWLYAPPGAGPRTFCLRVRGVSMEPKYHDGDIIFVDPDEEPRHGRRVIVRFERDKEATFKELVIEGERMYLKALNPAWPEPLVRVEHDATFVGVVIGKYVKE